MTSSLNIEIFLGTLICLFQLRIFMNQPNTLDFDKATGMEATQDVDITEKQLKGDIIPLKFVKFQNVNNIQFFFKVSSQ